MTIGGFVEYDETYVCSLLVSCSKLVYSFLALKTVSALLLSSC